MATINLGKKYEDDISTIYGVQFGILSPEEIMRRSVVSLTESTLYDSNGEPKFNGLFDARMGVIERNKLCKTCEQSYIACPGHFGHIELAKPVFYVQFINQIQEVMKCICIRCSKLLFDINDPMLKGILNLKKSEDYLSLLSSSIKTKVCGQFKEIDKRREEEGLEPVNHGCGAIQPNKYVQQELDYIVGEWYKEILDEKGEGGKKRDVIKQKFLPEMVLSIFKRISLDDAKILGFSADWCLPYWLICAVLPVVPPSVRPSVRQYNNQRSEDDLTQKYNDIIKHNNILKDKLAKKDVPEEQINGYVYLLQYDIATLIDNDGSKGNPPSITKGGRTIKAFKQRLNGKDGRVRSNLMGKRVDFSARSVISPDANLNIEELGVPLHIAMNLTYPEIVNKYNIDKLYEYVRNGAKTYPGAKNYKKLEDGKTRSLECMDTSKIVLNYGDIVNRHLMDGDIVLFNRQPSLHKMSMMAHSIRVMPELSFRLNINDCEPYNADFDGDEMNLHVPQSIQTVMELKYLAAVSKQVISPSYNTPIIKPAQDNLLGLFKITDDTVFFNQTDMMNLLMEVEGFDGRLPEPAIREMNPIRIQWTGKQLISIILPPISIRKGDAVIERGIIKSGQMDKKMSLAIVHTIFNDYGYLANQRYLNNLQKIVIKYMIRSGFSVGISDLIIHPDIRKKNDDIVVETKKEIADITKKIHLNTFENISYDVNAVYEKCIKASLGGSSEKIESNTKNGIDRLNRVKYIIDSGSKGSALNLNNMVSLLGQQSVDGARIMLGFSNRSLPHYAKYDNGLESKGFITSNYRDGLNPQEFFFHAMSGREGLIDTAVKTARSGYLQRKLIKATEDLKVHHDYTVRNSNGDIVQFLYGDDGLNSIYLERGINFDKIFLPIKETLEAKVILNVDDKWDTWLSQSAISAMKKTLDWKQRINKYNEYIYSKIDMLHLTYTKYLKPSDKPNNDAVVLYFPVNFGRIIDVVMKTYNLDKKNKCDISPFYIMDEFEKLYEDCKVNNMRNDLLELLTIDKIGVAILIKDLRITRVAFNHLINAIKTRFLKSLVQGGEMAGPLAAQSIGEVSTQLTLRSVDWDTGIIISCDGIIQTPLIGEFIDNYYDEMMQNPETAAKIQRLENDQIYIPLENDGHEWMAYSVDEFGVSKWTKLEAITRHPVINEDGSDTILEVELEDGRIVKATKAKSFLVYNEEDMRLIDTNGSDLKIGDMLPVVSKFVLTAKLKIIDHINMRDYLHPTEYIYGTEIHKALDIMREAESRGDNKWYNRHKNIDFIIPYGRSDAFRDAFINGHNTCANEIREGFVYNKSSGNKNITQIPDKLMLDYDFGYFCGAYMADGMANEFRIIISKHDTDFIKPICDLMERWNVGYRHVRSVKKEATDTNGEWVSNDHIFQSVMLANVIGSIFGHTCEDKVIPAWVLQAPVEFQKGLISGYFSGDGCVSEDYSIRASSISANMLDMIALILKRFGINTSIHKNKQDKKRFSNCKDFIYQIYVYKKYNSVFCNYFSLTINFKQLRLNASILKKESTFKYSELNEIIAMPIKSIKLVQPSEHKYSNGELKRWVYDLTVAETRNFSTLKGIQCVDTFHTAGSATGSSVNQGVPRLDELLNKQIPKKPQNQIYLMDEYNVSEEKADEIRYNIELVKISDILLSDAIYAEPTNDIEDVLEEDREIMKIYEVFSELDPKFKQIPNNPWIIRLEFNRREMVNKKITMEDVNLIIQQHLPSAVIVFADDNAGKMIFRMRLNFETNSANTDDDLNLLIKEIENIKNIIIKGVERINKVETFKNVCNVIKENGLYKTKTEYMLLSQGSNLAELLTKPYVDTVRTTTIDIIEAYEVLGIEAARWLLENQFQQVFESSAKNVCPRHIGLVSDLMTCKGKIMAANRNGINHSDIGPFAKISFEETIRQLKEAGLFGKYDHMTGVSSNIMFGQIPSCGTGDTELLIDEDAIADYIKHHPNAVSIAEEPISEDTQADFSAVFGTNGYCDENQDIAFNFNAIEGDILDLEDLPHS